MHFNFTNFAKAKNLEIKMHVKVLVYTICTECLRQLMKKSCCEKGRRPQFVKISCCKNIMFYGILGQMSMGHACCSKISLSSTG